MKTKWKAETLLEFEGKVAQMFEEGKINCPVHLCGGNENELINLFEVISPEDWVVATHRNHYHYLLKGGDEEKLWGELYGTENGMCKGKGRSMHLYDLSINFLTSAIVGGGPAIAVGLALSIIKKYPDKTKNRPHVYCFVGDGGEDTGNYTEAVRFSLGRELPITFVIEDNDLAVESTKEVRWKKRTDFNSPNVVRYAYTRAYPHVGIGKHVSM